MSVVQSNGHLPSGFATKQRRKVKFNRMNEWKLFDVPTDRYFSCFSVFGKILGIYSLLFSYYVACV